MRKYLVWFLVGAITYPPARASQCGEHLVAAQKLKTQIHEAIDRVAATPVWTFDFVSFVREPQILVAGPASTIKRAVIADLHRRVLGSEVYQINALAADSLRRDLATLHAVTWGPSPTEPRLHILNLTAPEASDANWGTRDGARRELLRLGFDAATVVMTTGLFFVPAPEPGS